MKFHYNKTTIQQFNRQLAIRQKALPILKNKETAMRMEVAKLSQLMEETRSQKEVLDQKVESFQAFWSEFPGILMMDDLGIYQNKVIGVKIPEIRSIDFKIADVSWWNQPAWVPSGIQLLMDVIRLDVKLDILRQQVEILDLARKKTTQKVNLYEKVQIPEYENAILMIKRFLEDKENISKAAQKIVKNRKEKQAA